MIRPIRCETWTVSERGEMVDGVWTNDPLLVVIVRDIKNTDYNSVIHLTIEESRFINTPWEDVTFSEEIQFANIVQYHPGYRRWYYKSRQLDSITLMIAQDMPPMPLFLCS